MRRVPIVRHVSTETGTHPELIGYFCLEPSISDEEVLDTTVTWYALLTTPRMLSQVLLVPRPKVVNPMLPDALSSSKDQCQHDWCKVTRGEWNERLARIAVFGNILPCPEHYKSEQNTGE